MKNSDPSLGERYVTRVFFKRCLVDTMASCRSAGKITEDEGAGCMLKLVGRQTGVDPSPMM